MHSARFGISTIPTLLAAFLALASMLVFSAPAHAQDAGVQITPSFGDGKLKILGDGFKPNENVTITVKLESGTSTLTAAADGSGRFELDTGIAVAPGSSVEIEARGDQGSGGAAITSVPVGLPLPQTGAAVPSPTPGLLVGLLLVVGGLMLVVRRGRHA